MTGVQTCALPIYDNPTRPDAPKKMKKVNKVKELVIKLFKMSRKTAFD